MAPPVLTNRVRIAKGLDITMPDGCEIELEVHSADHDDPYRAEAWVVVLKVWPPEVEKGIFALWIEMEDCIDLELLGCVKQLKWAELGGPADLLESVRNLLAQRLTEGASIRIGENSGGAPRHLLRVWFTCRGYESKAEVEPADLEQALTVGMREPHER